MKNINETKEELLNEIREEAKMCSHFAEEEFEANYWKIKNDLEEGKEPYFQTPYGAVDYFNEFLDGGNMWDEWEKKYGMDKDDIYELIGDTDFWKGYEVFKEIVYSEERKVWNEVYEEVEKDIMLEKLEKYKDTAEEIYEYDEQNENLFYAESDKYDFNYCSNYSWGFLNVSEDDDEDYKISFSSNQTNVYEYVYVAKEEWTIENIQKALYELNEKIVDTLIDEKLDDEALMKRMIETIIEEYEREEYFNSDRERYGEDDFEIVADIDLADDGRLAEDWEELVEQNLDELENMTGFHLWTGKQGYHLHLYIKKKEE